MAKTFSISNRGKYKVITLTGDATTLSVLKSLHESINNLLLLGDKHFVFDFSKTPLLNSQILGVLAKFYTRINAENGTCSVILKDKEQENVFNLAGLHLLVKVINTIDEIIPEKPDENISQELILVVDDSKTMRELIVKKVKTIGYPIITAKNGKEAVEQTLLHNPSLILMDIQMPEMNGFEACKTIKSKMMEKHIPIIFVTTLQDPKEKLNALEAGGDDYVNKPVQEEDLIFRIKTHLKVRELTESLEEMNKNLEKKVDEKSKALLDIERQLYQAEKMSVIGTMLSGIAHELKNPLFIIGGKAQQLLRKEKLNDILKKAITAIEEQATRSTKIIENLLKLVRKRVEEVVILDVSKLIKDLKENIDYLIDNKSIEIKLDLVKNCIIQGNITEIEQIIINLVSNAVDAIKENGVITVRTRDSKDTWLVEIEDDGSGMSQEVQKKIFDPFYTTKEVGKGTGLGMSIVYRIVENHKGKIQVRSEEGKGTVFSVYFPKYN